MYQYQAITACAIPFVFDTLAGFEGVPFLNLATLRVFTRIYTAFDG